MKIDDKCSPTISIFFETYSANLADLVVANCTCEHGGTITAPTPPHTHTSPPGARPNRWHMHVD